jgi:hypothetical protein
MGRATLIAVLGLLASAASALAAPPWSAPENVSSPALYVDGADVVVDRSGRAYATWRAAGDLRIAVREPRAPEFGSDRSSPDFLTPLLPYGSNRVTGLDARSGGRPEVISLRARFSRPDGSFGRPDTISTHGLAGGAPSLAVHDVALAAWIQGGSHGRRIVRAAIRRPGHSFGRPFTLRARGRARDVVAGAGPGVMFVAWERAGVVEARVKLTGRHSWGPVQRLGPTRKGGTDFRAAFAGRRGYLAWLAEGGEFMAVTVSVLPTRAARFRAPQTLETVNRDAPAEPHPLVLLPYSDRDVILAWTGWDGTTWRVRTSATNGVRFPGIVDISPPGEQAVLGDAAVGSPGDLIVLWSRLDAVGEVGDRVRGALRPAGGSFAGPEEVSDLDRARLPAVAFDTVAQRWIAVWSQRIGPDQGVPPNQITTFLRSATRPG